MIYIVLFLAIIGIFEVFLSSLVNMTKNLLRYLVEDLKNEEELKLGLDKYYPAIIAIITSILWVWFYYLSH